MAQAKASPSLQTLPQEIVDKVLIHCYSTTDVDPIDPGYVAPQELSNIRLVNRRVRKISTDAFLKRNFTCIATNLESRAPASTNGPGALDVALQWLNHFCMDTSTRNEHGLTGPALGEMVKTLRFFHPQQAIGGGGLNLATPPMSAADSTHLQVQLNSMFEFTENALTPNVETLQLDLRAMGPPPLLSMNPPPMPPTFNSLLRILSRSYNCIIMLKHVKLHGGHYDREILQYFLFKHRHTLESLDIRNVVLLTGSTRTIGWEHLVCDWRDNFPALRDVRLRRLSRWVLAPAAAAGGPQAHHLHGWTGGATEEFVDLSNPDEEQQYSFTTQTRLGYLAPTGMVGRYGVKVGLNKLLETNGTALSPFDPTLTLEALIQAGTLARKSEPVVETDG